MGAIFILGKSSFLVDHFPDKWIIIIRAAGSIFTGLVGHLSRSLHLHKIGLIKIKGIAFSKYYDIEDVKAIQKLYVPDNIKIIMNDTTEFMNCKRIECGKAVIYL